MKIEIEISDKAFELLKAIDKNGCAEFRDSEYDSFEQFKQSKEYLTPAPNGFRDEHWFRGRNFCDLKDLEDLHKYNLIDDGDGMAQDILCK